MLDVTLVARQGILYLHVIAFALAISTIIKEDVRLLLASRIDSHDLKSTATTTVWLLAALWFSGISLVAIETGMDVASILSKPKLVAKIAVVVVLTVNGAFLHWVAFPMLTMPQRHPGSAALICSLFGAVSTATWLFASFLGVARHVAPFLSLQSFMALYALALTCAATVSIVFVRAHIATLISGNIASVAMAHAAPANPMVVSKSHDEMEEAIAVLNRTHDLLRGAETLSPSTSLRPSQARDIHNVVLVEGLGEAAGSDIDNPSFPHQCAKAVA